MIRHKTKLGRSFYICLIGYLIVGVSGCTNPPRAEKPPTSVARAMENSTATIGATQLLQMRRDVREKIDTDRHEKIDMNRHEKHKDRHE